MLIKIDFESEIPIYTQIKNQIVEGIANGELAEGESLPSVRQLAGDIAVNMHTVNKAYSLLKDKGFVSVHKRKGVVVNKLSQMNDESFLNEISFQLKTVIAEAYCKGISEESFVNICKNYYSKFNKDNQNGD